MISTKLLHINICVVLVKFKLVAGEKGVFRIENKSRKRFKNAPF